VRARWIQNTQSRPLPPTKRPDKKEPLAQLRQAWGKEGYVTSPERLPELIIRDDPRKTGTRPKDPLKVRSDGSQKTNFSGKPPLEREEGGLGEKKGGAPV